MEQKLPKKKYLRVHPIELREWIFEIMKDKKMRFAKPADVANEIEKKYGGLAKSHLSSIYRLRLKMENFLPKEEKEKREKLLGK